MVVAALLCMCLGQAQALEHLHLDNSDETCVVCLHADTSVLVATVEVPADATTGYELLQQLRPRSADVQRAANVRTRAPPYSD